FILGMAAKPSFSAIFNVASDFSVTNNPNGAWRYGWSSSLESNFNLYSNVGKLTPTTGGTHLIEHCSSVVTIF
ncbi:MAG TPA: hypothetical protein VE956_15300, partial [Nodularia sp. (in: cyanobacteria)]|nr:hypothetical protein [Nodularia sp. (in: cyanobacteria)]